MVSNARRRHRSRPRWRASLLLLAWLAPLVVPHTADDDALCAPLVNALKAGAVWTSVTDDAQQVHHCAICHSIRSCRSALSDCGPVTVSLTAADTVDATAEVWHRATALDKLPARAPPV